MRPLCSVRGGDHLSERDGSFNEDLFAIGGVVGTGPNRPCGRKETIHSLTAWLLPTPTPRIHASNQPLPPDRILQCPSFIFPIYLSIP